MRYCSHSSFLETFWRKIENADIFLCSDATHVSIHQQANGHSPIKTKPLPFLSFTVEDKPLLLTTYYFVYMQEFSNTDPAEKLSL